MSRIQIPIDALTSRLNLQDRLQGLRSGPLSGRFANLRPISEFCDFKRLSKPDNFSEVQSRVNYNLGYFSTNYLAVFAMLSIYSLLTNWILLFDIIFVIAGMFVINRLDGRDLEIGSFRATSSQLQTGLLVIGVPLFLFASPFSTLLWLIGASGVTILGFFRGGGLGGRPRAPKFAPQSGRPSRRGRRKTDGDVGLYELLWGAADPRVKELETDDDDDSDSQGVGLSDPRRQTRFVSDSLQFTGTDLGDRSGGVRHRYQQYHDTDDDDEEEESEDETSVSDSDDDDDDGRSTQIALRDKEDALIQSALKRISRAQAKGRADVKLNKEELAALERQRRRMQEEEDRRRNSIGSGSDRKKKKHQQQDKEQRLVVPLSSLEPVSRKKKSAHPPRQDSLPSHVSAPGPRSNSPKAYPPMGYFAPPSGSSSRSRGTRVGHEGHSPPVSYDYVPRPSSGQRIVSESSTRPHSRGLPHEESWIPHGNGIDPFQYQTAGPRYQYPPGAAAGIPKRHSGGSDIMYSMQRPSTSSRSRHGSRRTSRSRLADSSTSEEQTSSDDLGNGAQIREPVSRGRHRDIVVEVSPEPEPEPEPSRSKKKSSSPTKRKPTSTGGKKKKK